MTDMAFGIDIGGSGIKGALVDLSTGTLAANRVRIPTPDPSTPKAVAQTVSSMLAAYPADLAGLPIGITIPAVVTHGVTRSAANIDKKWIDYPAQDVLGDILGRPVVLMNDADAAGLAEVRYGAAKDHDGMVIVTTLGTGIGTAMIYRGVLIPNFELGHLEIDGFDAEKRAAASARTKENLSWPAYGKRLLKYYQTLEKLFTPDLFVVGGGVSKDFDQYAEYLTLSTPIIPAQLRNQAGIVGAARYAADGATA